MTRPGLYRPMPIDPSEPREAQKPLHPAQERLLDELRKRRHGTVIISFQDGLPMNIVPVLTDAKQKLA